MGILDKILKAALDIYPVSLRKFLKESVIISREERLIRGERVDGSYDVETGEIILWDPQKNDEEDLFIILTHEWGHKIYHEWLSDKDRSDWLTTRSKENIDFGQGRFYPPIKLPEEEYCAVFTVISKALFWRNMGMKTESKRLFQRINKEFPSAAAVVQRQIGKSTKIRRSVWMPSRRDITHQEVEIIKKWIRRAIQN